MAPNRNLAQGFKHVAIDFAEQFAAGAVRIGTFDYYRAMEGDRRDPLEGIAINVVTKTIGEAGPTKRDEEIFAKLGIAVKGGKRGRFYENHSVDSPPSPYIFCCSEEPDFLLAARDSLAIFAITDLVGFGEAVIKAAGKVFDKAWKISSVSYLPRTGSPFETGRILTADPLVKDSKFTHEREVRFLFEPKGAPKTAYLDLKVPAIRAFIHRLA